MTNVIDVRRDGRFAGQLVQGERDLMEFLFDGAYRGRVWESGAWRRGEWVIGRESTRRRESNPLRFRV